MSNKFVWKLLSIFRVWFQTFLTIEVAMHISDVLNGKFLWKVCLGACIPVVIRWATPTDAFPDEKEKTI
jgi:hypothetical protein